MSLLDNFPPKILSGATEVNVTVNTTASITVTAMDPNNDSLTFSVIGSLPNGAKVSSNVSSITLTWNVTTDQVNTEQSRCCTEVAVMGRQGGYMTPTFFWVKGKPFLFFKMPLIAYEYVTQLN